MKLIAQFRVTVAYLLLMVFSLVALPKELWHHNAHQSVSLNIDIKKNSDQTTISATQEVCPICAIHIFPFISQADKGEYFEITVNQIFTADFYVDQEYVISSGLRLRGPPIV